MVDGRLVAEGRAGELDAVDENDEVDVLGRQGQQPARRLAADLRHRRQVPFGHPLQRRAAFGRVHQRTGSLAPTGLVHTVSNATAVGLVGRLYVGTPDGIVALAMLGLVVMVATRGRLGWPRHTKLGRG